VKRRVGIALRWLRWAFGVVVCPEAQRAEIAQLKAETARLQAETAKIRARNDLTSQFIQVVRDGYELDR
jgi:DNA-binding IclR family transcriptional regulator